MKSVFSLVLCLILVASSNAQITEKFSIELQSRMKEKKRGGAFQVIIIGSHQVDFNSLKQYWSDNDFTLEQRRKATLKALYIQRENNQFALIDKLWEEGVSIEIEHVFWSANFIQATASIEALNFLAKQDLVYRVELLEEQLATPHLPVSTSSSPIRRSFNGIEPGITAVKAPYLWNLGYTGQNTKLLSFDTGIWPEHPSLRDKFLGHHLPLNQAWYGYDSFYPIDKSSSHGTHTSGTVMGLDPANNDTIGIAFNSYVMATDPIVSISADIKPLAEIALAYEWALNPDGDTSTVSDMPDVINNSWGHTFDPINDSAACSGFFADVLVAIEAADIISVQSAGNSGPADSTVGAPSLANMTLVNNFSVGAINGGNPSYPIASFSSRGPSHCPSTGALAIKPEVVAPGVNVRSAIRNSATFEYEYSNYQGTSMAAPHVSGIALLLREAFPQATAEEIKESLYYTAIDLGVSGEDNDYGRGMIDAEAAYNYLSQTYVPLIPNLSPLDLVVSGIDMGINSTYSCDTIFIPKVYFKNSNPTSWALMQLEYGFVGEPINYYSGGTGMFNPEDSVLLDPISTTPGWKEFYARLVYTGGAGESDYINNTWYERLKVQSKVQLPYREDFEVVHPYVSSMQVEDFDQIYTWDSARVVGPENSTNSVFMRHSRYSPRTGQKNNLISPLIELPQSGNIWLTFDLSYQFDAIVFRDSLKIWVSTNCDGVFDQLVYEKGPEDLNTTAKAKVNEWIPEDVSDWRRDTVDLSAFTGLGQFMLKFESINRQGNNLYLDNINIFDNRGPVSADEIDRTSLDWKLYPNPTRDRLTIQGIEDDFKFSIYDVLGKQLQYSSVEKSNGETFIDVSRLKPGIYFLEIDDKGKKDVKKFIIE